MFKEKTTECNGDRTAHSHFTERIPRRDHLSTLTVMSNLTWCECDTLNLRDFVSKMTRMHYLRQAKLGDYPFSCHSARVSVIKYTAKIQQIKLTIWFASRVRLNGHGPMLALWCGCGSWTDNPYTLKSRRFLAWGQCRHEKFQNFERYSTQRIRIYSKYTALKIIQM